MIVVRFIKNSLGQAWSEVNTSPSETDGEGAVITSSLMAGSKNVYGRNKSGHDANLECSTQSVRSQMRHRINRRCALADLEMQLR